MLAQNPSTAESVWRGAVWATLIIFAALTFWWVQPAPVVPETQYDISLAVPSEWVEQARVTSPDGTLDALVVHADDCVALQSRTGPEGQPPATMPTTTKEGDEADRVLSVRIVPKGEKVPQDQPYLHRSQLFTDRVIAESVFVSLAAPNLKVSWTDDETLKIQNAPQKALAKLSQATPKGDNERRIAITYSP